MSIKDGNNRYRRFFSFILGLQFLLQAKELVVEVQKLPTYCLLSSAVITYLTSQSENNRRYFHFDEYWRIKAVLTCSFRILLQKFTEVLQENGYDFEQFMSTKRELMQWQGEGLPNDRLSMQNAIMITKVDTHRESLKKFSIFFHRVTSYLY